MERDGQIIVGYYLDEKAQIPTTAQNSGAVEKAGALALPGQYYVKVTALEVKDFYQETSEIFSYQINFDARIRMQRIADSESIDYAYTGNPWNCHWKKEERSPGAAGKHRHP